MIHRPLQRRSRIAGWSRALGAFAVPLVVIVLVGLRLDQMSPDQALVLGAVAVAFAAVALVLGAAAAALIWHDGRLGARNAVFGMIWATLALAPAAGLALLWASHPRLVDVATDAVDPPLFRAAAFARVGRANSPTAPDVDERTRVRARTPDLAPRRFSVGSDLLFAVTRRRVEAEGWTITDLAPPRGDGDRGRIEAIARSPILGLADDVVIRILPEPSGARIDMRSSIRWGDHDLGRGARRIRAFLDDLDKAVTETYGR